jgi:hypothetical protein
MLVVCLFCCSQTFAKEPLPEVLLNAKTAIVKNDGALEKDFAKFYDAMKKWGRFELVEERSKADIIVWLSADIKVRNIQIPSVNGSMGIVQSQNVIVYDIRILNEKDETPLWSDSTSVESSDPKRLVSNLQHKMKKK